MYPITYIVLTIVRKPNETGKYVQTMRVCETMSALQIFETLDWQKHIMLTKGYEFTNTIFDQCLN
jgi:hypothetical protein